MGKGMRVWRSTSGVWTAGSGSDVVLPVGKAPLMDGGYSARDSGEILGIYGKVVQILQCDT